jgi:hypothetical protein
MIPAVGDRWDVKGLKSETMILEIDAPDGSVRYGGEIIKTRSIAAPGRESSLRRDADRTLRLPTYPGWSEGLEEEYS